MRRATHAAVALVAAASGLLVGGGATAAQAAPKIGFIVSTGFPRTLPVRTDGHGDGYRPLDLDIYGTMRTVLHGVKVAVDASAVSGFAELDLPAGCTYTTSDHLHELCSLGDLTTGSGRFAVGVRATPGAHAGSTGDVVFKVTATNGTEYIDPNRPHDTVDVTVGDGPDLALNNLGDSIKVAPGANTALPLRVTNVGSQDAKGVVMFIHDQYDVATVLGNYSNCLYQTHDHGQRDARCTFNDAVVKPGQTLELKDPFTLAMPAGAHGDQIQYGAGLVGDAWTGPTEGTAGTGSALTLVPVVTPTAQARSADPSHDIDVYNNLYYTDLATGNVTDVSGVGGSVTTTVGKDTAITFGVRNTGTTTLTSTLDPLSSGVIMVWALFPTSVQVTGTPKGCITSGGGPEGLSAYPLDGPAGNHLVSYGCSSTQHLEPGQQADFTFHVKPLKEVQDQYAGMVAGAVEDPTANFNNNIAHVYINTTKAGPQPTTTATGPAPQGGKSEELAETGGGHGLMWTATGGAGVLALGAAGVLGARRRKATNRS